MWGCVQKMECCHEWGRSFAIQKSELLMKKLLPSSMPVYFCKGKNRCQLTWWNGFSQTRWILFRIFLLITTAVTINTRAIGKTASNNSLRFVTFFKQNPPPLRNKCPGSTSAQFRLLLITYIWLYVCVLCNADPFNTASGRTRMCDVIISKIHPSLP